VFVFALRRAWCRSSLHGSNLSPDVNLPLDLEILERLLPELLLPYRTCTAGDGAGGWAPREYAVDARLAHLVVAYWTDEEPHVLVEIAGGFADGANV